MPASQPTVLTIRKIGNSQGVLIPKTMLEELNAPDGFEAWVKDGELHLRPAMSDDPFGFGAAFLAQVADDAVDPLLLPDVLPEDDWEI